MGKRGERGGQERRERPETAVYTAVFKHQVGCYNGNNNSDTYWCNNVINNDSSNDGSANHYYDD